MIIPAGKVRHQVNQGAFKNESTWNELLEKFAITGADLAGKPTPKAAPKPADPNLSKALGPGSNSPALSGAAPRGSAMPGAEGRMPGEPIQSPTGIPPETPQETPGAKAPASQFMEPESADQQSSVQRDVIQEQQKIQKFIADEQGFSEFALSLTPRADGTFTIALKGQRPIQRPGPMFSELMKLLNARPSKDQPIEFPDSVSAGQALKFTYSPAEIPQKVTKGK